MKNARPDAEETYGRSGANYGKRGEIQTKWKDLEIIGCIKENAQRERFVYLPRVSKPPSIRRAFRARVRVKFYSNPA